MRIRIPTRINRVLDGVGRHQWAVSAAVSAAAVVLLAAAVWVSRTGAGIATGLLLVVFITGTYGARIRQLREQVRQRDYDMAAKDAEIARLSAGDPTAPTTQLRSIGDGGELL